MRNTIIYFVLVCFTISCSTKKDVDNSEKPSDWIQLFNGKDMKDWTPKMKGYKMGDNFNNTFRVADGFLKASYSEYDSFRYEFGHLFYKDKFSYYRLRAEYRPVGKHTPNGPGWAFANNGLMLHCQSVETMTLDQEFPVSIECQLLGGKGDGETRTTGNLCTPGCHVTLRDSLFKPHCVGSTSKTYDVDEWVTIEVVVLGDSIIHHIVEGDTVLTYTNPIIGGGLDGLDTLKFPDGTRMTEGYIAIQAESHGFDFRKIELLDLCGCMDKKAENYKDYYVKHLPDACVYK